MVPWACLFTTFNQVLLVILVGVVRLLRQKKPGHVEEVKVYFCFYCVLGLSYTFLMGLKMLDVLIWTWARFILGSACNISSFFDNFSKCRWVWGNRSDLQCLVCALRTKVSRYWARLVTEARPLSKPGETDFVRTSRYYMKIPGCGGNWSWTLDPNPRTWPYLSLSNIRWAE